MIDSLIVLAKQPIPGRVKTRLVPAVSPSAAASLAAACLADTLELADRCAARRRLLVFRGDPSGWQRPGWQTLAQTRGGLAARIAGAFDAAGSGSALLIGMDTPQLHPAQLAAFDPRRFNCCLGPATDGGYWTIGFRDARQARRAVTGIPMSTPDTGRRQLERLHRLGLEVQLLAELTDIDTIEDAVTVATLAPATAFATRLRQLLPPALRGAA